MADGITIVQPVAAPADELWRACATAEGLQRWQDYRTAIDGAASAERALLAAGMPQLDADAICNGLRPARVTIANNIKAHFRAVQRLEKRIAGLERWEARRSA